MSPKRLLLLLMLACFRPEAGAAPAAKGPQLVLRVSAASAPIHRGADLKSPVEGQALRGQTLLLAAEKTFKGFYKVAYQGHISFVAAGDVELLDLSAAKGSSTVAAAAPSPAPSPAAAKALAEVPTAAAAATPVPASGTLPETARMPAAGAAAPAPAATALPETARMPVAGAPVPAAAAATPAPSPAAAGSLGLAPSLGISVGGKGVQAGAVSGLLRFGLVARPRPAASPAPTPAFTTPPSPSPSPTSSPAPVLRSSPSPTPASGLRGAATLAPTPWPTPFLRATAAATPVQVWRPLRSGALPSSPAPGSALERREASLLPWEGKLNAVEFRLDLGGSKHPVLVQPPFKPLASDSDQRAVESAGFAGLGVEFRAPSWLRYGLDWTAFSHSTKAATQGTAAPPVALTGATTPVPFPASDAFYRMDTQAFRAQLKLSLPFSRVEPWVNGSFGPWAWSSRLCDAQGGNVYGQDQGWAWAGTLGTGVDFHGRLGARWGWTLGLFAEWGAPQVEPTFRNVRGLGLDWKDSYGTPAAVPARFGLRFGLGF